MGKQRKLVEHPDSADIAAALAKATAGAFRGTVYRSAEPLYARRAKILTGRGSAKHGGRWNPFGVATVYGSTTPETAMAESVAHLRRYGFDPADAFPRVFVAVELKLSAVIDLTNAATRRKLGISLTTIHNENWRKENARGHETRTQAIGRLSAAAGFEGLIVPACDGGKNVNWFPTHLRHGSTAKLSR